MAQPGRRDGSRVEEAWLRTAEQAEERASRYERLTEQAESISVTETSALASVTVDISGAVTGLTLVEELGGRRGSEVAADVLALMRRAQARLTERMAAVAAATVGPDDRVGAGLTERLRDRFGQPAEPGPPAADEDFGDESIMRRY